MSGVMSRDEKTNDNQMDRKVVNEIQKIVPSNMMDGYKSDRPANNSKSKAINEIQDLLKLHKELDKRVMGQMRADHVQEGTKRVFYG